ncbi:sensor domain-containing protein [Geodermatophilus ruber]|uniref:PAS domain S-box-containing protein/diguanylate cyclase (GGDEF) domain-containing protein n=1 Tax=Geodermatophilus ruber TaxID=504800 RepID=A0A1I4H5T5_9ACTN|nr:diguanylate cyclase [Geodermatophilus ruber]SFL36987.1 PAS domain S-box-containing protein/diguanylate cyclase (GGDEF) domain-containing protein [Geodermatophilus ruber]
MTPGDTDFPEEDLEDLYEHAPCGYLSTRPDGTVVKVNATFLDWTGHRAEDVIGRPFQDLLTPGGRIYHQTHVAPLLRLQGSVKAIALELLCPGGRRLPVLVSSDVRADASGTPVLVRTAVVDHTERRSYERELVRARKAAEDSERRVRVLHRAAAQFAEATSTAEVVAALAGILADEPGNAGAGVWLVDPDRAALVHAGEDGPPAASVADAAVPAAAPVPLAAAVRGHDVVAVPTPAAAEQDFPAVALPMHRARVESLLAVPLAADGGVVGAYQATFRRRRGFTPEQLELHRTLARQAGAAIERSRLDEEVRHLAQHDPLTGAANRALFTSRLDQALADARRTGAPVSAMFLDLDGFKAVNDGHGHSAGDDLLVEIAQRLRRVVRPRDTVGRLGGDEFAVLCAGADPAEAAHIARRLEEAVRAPVAVAGRSVTVTVTASVGIVVHDPGSCPPASAGQLLRYADAAMYRAKALGKDRHVMYDTTFGTELPRLTAQGVRATLPG